MHEVMRFWLRKGVDGFRVDVIWHLIKDDEFRDNPVNPAYAAGMPPNQRSCRFTPPTCRRCMRSWPAAQGGG